MEKNLVWTQFNNAIQTKFINKSTWSLNNVYKWVQGSNKPLVYLTNTTTSWRKTKTCFPP